MEYSGPLYGKIGRRFFEITHTDKVLEIPDPAAWKKLVQGEPWVVNAGPSAAAFGLTVKISERYRPDSEVSPWIHKEIRELENQFENLRRLCENQSITIAAQAAQIAKHHKPTDKGLENV